MPAIQRASKGTKVPDAEDAPTSGAGRAVRAAMGDDREVQVADIPRFLPAVFKDLRADLRFFGVSAVMLASSLFLFYCLVTGWTPMHHCVQHDMQTALRLLLAMGISPNVEYPPTGRTPLHLASAGGNDELIRLLLAGGASTDSKDTMGASPLLLAVASMDKASVGALLRAGADPDAPDKVAAAAPARRPSSSGRPGARSARGAGRGRQRGRRAAELCGAAARRSGESCAAARRGAPSFRGGGRRGGGWRGVGRRAAG